MIGRQRDDEDISSRSFAAFLLLMLGMCVVCYVAACRFTAWLAQAIIGE